MNASGILILFLLILSGITIFLWAQSEFRRKEQESQLIRRTKELEQARRTLSRMGGEMDSAGQKGRLLDDTMKKLATLLKSGTGQDPDFADRVFEIVSAASPKALMGTRKPGAEVHRDERDAKDVFQNIKRQMGRE